MSEPVVVGLDLAASTGWAVMTLDGVRVDSGSWRLSGIHIGERWRRFRTEFAALLTRFEGLIAVVSVEKPITYGARGRASGARSTMGTIAHVEHIAYGRGIEVVEYAPASIKKELSGNGRATKEDQIASAERRFGPLTSSTKVSKGDEADAIGACVTALNRLDIDELRNGDVIPLTESK